ncbi:hypothetical protein NHX12_015186 [Muraenolepis orangiensis]|uniref:Mitochondrial pyruvate carrier n=1 Tax=Muraenolepis orangiensis TaxID=630683 RepID=A0A9Q0DA91_9TELE|nr:hypothetical protein NHX12_015186 [Muraenolepis orangiensis]
MVIRQKIGTIAAGYRVVALVEARILWSRYSLVIVPRVWNLFAVNFFLGIAGATQMFRIWRYNVALNKELPALQEESPAGGAV